MPYHHAEIEKKWQKFWDEHQTFATPSTSDKPKKYILDMFPYPSGTGLHVGHPKGYTGTDIVSRYYHAKGYNVLHPMGFDAFGLPAENFAIKTGTHPAVTTQKNIETFVTQLKSLGFSYDWSRVVDTTDPKYYQWTQWIFSELFKKGLAYEQNLPINYCPSCKTGLANEEVLTGNVCERCGTLVERRALRQWVLKITDYADRLITDLDNLDWSESVKDMQKNWIGKSEGCEFEMKKALKKDETYFSDGVGLNCPAKVSSYEDSIWKNAQKVKKKRENLRHIDVTVQNGDKHIHLNSTQLFKHFSSKGAKNFYARKRLLSTVYQ